MERKGAYYIPTDEEFELFYSGSSRENDCVGHLRGYFDGSDIFWHEWCDHVNSSSLNTNAFKAEFYPLMDSLTDTEFASRKNAGILWQCAQPLEDNRINYRGVKLITEHYEFYVRVPEDVRCIYIYVYCYKKEEE